jgi:UPF0716 protein FxsA
MRLLLLLFVIIPLFELFLLIQIGSHIGALTTIVWLVLAGILGVAILRLQGALTLIQARESMARGEPPAEALGNGMLLALAGVLLIIPGFVSDLAAFLLLIPPFRRLLLRRWAARAEKRSYYYSGRVYEGEVEPEPPRTSGSQLLEGELVEPERDNDKDKDNSQTR